MRRLATFAIVFLVACSAEKPAAQTQTATAPAIAGDAARGKEFIEKYACTACHHIPGFEGDSGSLGPDLAGIASRSEIGGRVPNNPATMASYLQNPPGVDPSTRMPPLGVSEEEARHITAYLFTLR